MLAEGWLSSLVATGEVYIDPRGGPVPGLVPGPWAVLAWALEHVSCSLSEAFLFRTDAQPLHWRFVDSTQPDVLGVSANRCCHRLCVRGPTTARTQVALARGR